MTTLVDLGLALQGLGAFLAGIRVLWGGVSLRRTPATAVARLRIKMLVALIAWTLG